jgi:hypothetical protein
VLLLLLWLKYVCLFVCLFVITRPKGGYDQFIFIILENFNTWLNCFTVMLYYNSSLINYRGRVHRFSGPTSKGLYWPLHNARGRLLGRSSECCWRVFVWRRFVVDQSGFSKANKVLRYINIWPYLDHFCLRLSAKLRASGIGMTIPPHPPDNL